MVVEFLGIATLSSSFTSITVMYRMLVFILFINFFFLLIIVTESSSFFKSWSLWCLCFFLMRQCIILLPILYYGDSFLLVIMRKGYLRNIFLPLGKFCLGFGRWNFCVNLGMSKRSPKYELSYCDGYLQRKIPTMDILREGGGFPSRQGQNGK